ncbi:MAG: hypothetical protein Q7J45_01285 [bacterium]|nr:hypothetical protein [bacterium]
MSPDHALNAVLDSFPASQLHSTWRLVRALIPLAEATQRDTLKPLERISLTELAKQGLQIAQVIEAAEVLLAVHKTIHKEPDVRAGIGALRIRPPKVSVDGFLIGLNSLPLQKIDEKLSEREHSFPLGQKTNIQINARAGTLRVFENLEPVVELAPKEADCIRLIYTGLQKERLSLKKMTLILNSSSDSNTSRLVRTINAAVLETLKLPYPLIRHSTATGYFLNTEQYNIQVS